jgi:hypothetical protein
MMESADGNSRRREIKPLAIRNEFCSGCSCTGQFLNKLKIIVEKF